MARRPPSAPGPYMGLVPYTEEDHPYFFGRTKLRRVVAGNLKSVPVTALYGPSGVGKSSLLAAGVVHDLMVAARASAEERGRIGHLPVLFGRWRDDYRKGLAEEIVARARNLGADSGLDPAQPLADLCESWIRSDRGRLLLLLDQFEEFFLYHTEKEEQLSLGRLLFALAEKGARVMLSLREDQLALLDRLRPALPDIFANQLRVDHLDAASAREAIEGPVQKWNELTGTDYAVEGALTDTLLAELQPGRMKLRAAGAGLGSGAATQEIRVQAPWLQIVMKRLWNEEVQTGSKVLRLETLTRLHGVVRIAEMHLDQEMEGLRLRERAAASTMFPWLVTPSGTKVLYPEDDLIAKAWLFPSAAKPVLNKLSGAGRILERIDSGDGARYQIYHDQLGPAILDWRHRFLRRTALTSGLTGLALAVLCVGLITIPPYLTAERKSTEVSLAASALTSLSRTDLTPNVRQALALYAWFGSENQPVMRKGAGEACLREFPVNVRHVGLERLLTVAFSPNAQQIAIGGQGDGIWLMTRNGTAVENRYGIQLLDAPGIVTALAFGDPKYLAATGDRGVMAYNPAEGRVRLSIASGIGTVERLALNQAGTLLAGAGTDGRIQIWDPGTGKQLAILKFHTSKVKALVFNPKRPELASADEAGRVAVWRGGQNATPHELPPLPGPAGALQYSPDGQYLAGSSMPRRSDGALYLWSRAADGNWTIAAQAKAPQIESLGFSGPPLRIVAGTTNGLWLWSLPQLAVVKTAETGAGVNWLDVSSGLTRIVSVQSDRSLRLWKEDLRPVFTLPLGKIEVLPPSAFGSALGSSPSTPPSPFQKVAVVPVGNASLGILGAWDAAYPGGARLLIMGAPWDRLEGDVTSGGALTAYQGSTPIGVIPNAGAGPAVRIIAGPDSFGRVADNWAAAVAAARSHPPPPLTEKECQDLLGVQPCPPLPKP